MRRTGTTPWAAILVLLVADFSPAHEHTRSAAVTRLIATEGDQHEPPPEDPSSLCRLTLDLRLDGRPTSGLVRITDLTTGETVKLRGQIHRENRWYAVDVNATLSVPQASLQIEALHGLETRCVEQTIDLDGRAEATLRLDLPRVYDPLGRGLVSGNTHLHLMKVSYESALEYLRLVPAADGLDLVFVSHLRRFPDERRYITNRIVEESFAGGTLARLSRPDLRLRPGEEHRHNFGRGGEGFGHVMLLDITRLVRPVSIGPGIMGKGYDSVPLQDGIQAARKDGATVVWCHNSLGFEDIPNQLAGLVHAQNIFDGGSSGSYEQGFYRYLNLGMQVPFSTGTDWFIYDFSRVYVPLTVDWTSRQWLAALREGRSYITNGPFLEFDVAGRSSGDTIDLAAPRTLTVTGRAVGRNRFGTLELVHNGRVVQTVDSQLRDGSYVADLVLNLEVVGPGWLAMRIGPSADEQDLKNELGRPLFAHTSPVYLTLQGERIFQYEIARELVGELRSSVLEIEAKGTFERDAQSERVLAVYHTAIEQLERRLAKSASTPGAPR